MADDQNRKRLRSAAKGSSIGNEVAKKLPQLKKMEPLITRLPNSSISESHLRLLREEKRCDVTFLVGSTNEKIRGHQLFLMARSPVFEAMFSDRWIRGTEIQIPDVEPTTFRTFLEFVYGDKLEVASVSAAVDLTYVAQKYDVQPLVQKCEILVKLNSKLEDCVDLVQAARKYGNENFLKIAGDILAAASSLEIIENEKALAELDRDTFTYLLKRDDLKAKEVELFKISVKWGKTQVKLGCFATLEEALMDVIPLIRFPIMASDEFTTVVVPTGLLPQSTLLQIFTYFGSPKATQKDLAKALQFNTNPRMGPLRGTVVSLYEGPVGRQGEPLKLDLRDEVEFNIKMDTNCGKCNAGKKAKEIAMNGIILHCPLKEPQPHGNQSHCASTPVLHDLFQLYIKSYAPEDPMSYRSLVDSCQTEMLISPVKLLWGKEMEVKVEPPVLLKDGHSYTIILSGVQSSANSQHYRFQTFGAVKSATELEMESCNVEILHIKEPPLWSVIHKIRVVDQ